MFPVPYTGALAVNAVTTGPITRLLHAIVLFCTVMRLIILKVVT